MKRLFFVALLLTLALPTWAADQPAPTQPSIETLRAAIFSPADPSAAPEGAVWKASCTVTNDCGPNSPTISCTSASGNCTSGADFVQCDGVRKNCAPCHVSTNCSNGRTFSCTGTTINDC
ncbi:MAG TPA: hypothetical protein VF173_38220, partial [Thermoanaerobaculia bacterium]|nr:hypothetical protein [Thermoanaerobaculia bacterium]